MSKQLIGRMVAVPVGAMAVFWLQHGLGMQFYIAIPLAILAYIVTLVAMRLTLGSDTPAK